MRRAEMPFRLSVVACSVILALPVHAYESTAAGNVYQVSPLKSPVPAEVVLSGLLDSPYLESTRIKIENEACIGCGHSLADRTGTDHFLYVPGQAEFAEVTAYHHLTSFSRYVTKELGFAINNTQLPVTLGLDEVGADFSSGFGIRKLDIGTRINQDDDGDWFYDSEHAIQVAHSSDAIVHEYAHAIIDSLSPLSMQGLPWFLQEGWADYLAASYNNDPYIGEWINQDSFRGYRRSLVEAISAEDLWPANNLRANDGISDSVYLQTRDYYNSMRWSGFLWRLRERIAYIGQLNDFDAEKARQLSDSIVLKGIQYYEYENGGSNTPEPEILEAKEALKTALAYLQSLSPFIYQYDWYYQFITASDIDAAFERRYRAAYNEEDRDYLYKISLDQRELAAARQTGRRDVVLAVIDTGLIEYPFYGLYDFLGTEDRNLNGLLDASEPDRDGNGVLSSGNMRVNPAEIPGDGVDNDGNGFVDDVYGWDFVDNDGVVITPSLFETHGSNVTMYAGQVAWSAAIMPIRNYTGTEWVKQNARLTAGLKYAREHDADVVNVSQAYHDGTFDSSQHADSLDPAESFNMAGFNQIKAALRSDGTGPVFLAAAGNDNFDLDLDPVYPASFPLPNVISVTGSSLDDQFRTLNHGHYSVDLSAPENSTSMATPLVSGAITLLLSEQKDRQESHPGYRSLTVGEIKYLLLMSTDHPSSLERKAVSKGRLNVNTLLRLYEDDADWDGYSRQIEALFGTDPENPVDHPDLLMGDADGDGLVNHLELGYGSIPVPIDPFTNYQGILYPIYLTSEGLPVQGLDPTDSDGDGLGDLAETQGANGYYSDPANPDTDGDGVLDGVDPSPSYAKEDLRNVALLRPTEVNDDFYGLRIAEHATDGNTDTYWSTGADVPAPHWLRVELGETATIHRARVLLDDLFIPSEFSIQFSLDGDFDNGVVYEYPVTGNTITDLAITLSTPVEARYARLLITDPNAHGTGNNFARVREFEVDGVQPRNLALGRPTTTTEPLFVSEWNGAKATDGVTTGFNFWSTNPGAEGPHWLAVDLGADSAISEIHVIFYDGMQIPPYYKFQFSDSGDFSNDTTIAPYEIRVDNPGLEPIVTTALYAPISARYVRLVIEEPSDDYVRVTEVIINGTSH